MSSIRLEGITKDFGDTRALDDVSLEVRDGEFFVLLGPTGAGKTTTLRVIAGLETQDSGGVWFDDEDMRNVPPADRDTAFVFQQYSLYPNMTVYENLAFPLKSPLRKMASADIETRIQETARKLHISHLLDRKTARLSGGEMQRVSLGRAIVREPRAFLMDEPLSNLDAKLRESLRVELEHLQKTQGITTLFVTHDQTEALTMADRLGVLREGQLIQVGTPEDIYDRPANTFVAQLVGSPKINLLPAWIAEGEVRMTEGGIGITTAPEHLDLPETFQVGIRPEDIVLRPDGDRKAKVVLTEPLGVETVVHLEAGGKSLTAVTTGITSVRIGDRVAFDVSPDHLHYFDADGQRIRDTVAA